MPEELEILDFPPDFPDDIQTLYLLPIENFYRHFMARQLVYSN